MLLNNNLYKIKDIYYNDFWKCLNWRLAPKFYRQLLESILGGFYHITASFAVFCKAKMEALRPKQNSVSKH